MRTFKTNYNTYEYEEFFISGDNVKINNFIFENNGKIEIVYTEENNGITTILYNNIK